MIENTPIHSGTKYQPEIDGLRAIALLAVMLYHAGFNAFGGGYVGVDVFFVISGYLICGIILRELADGSFSLANFFERRMRRILPALFTVMFVCIPVAGWFFLPADLQGFSISMAASVVFAANFWFWRVPSGYFGLSSEQMPWVHLWSLAIEEQFYLIFPIVMIVTWMYLRRWLSWVLVSGFCASLLLCVIAARYAPSANFYLLPTRAWELLMGAILALVGTEHLRSKMGKVGGEALALAGVALILFPVFLLERESSFPWPWALPVTIGTAIVIIFAPTSRLVGGLLASRPLVAIGLISYGAYLWHQPLLAFGRTIALRTLTTVDYALLLLAAFGLAYLSWRFIERPIRNRSNFSRKQIFAGALTLGAVLLSLGTAGWYFKGFPARFSEADRAMAKVGPTYGVGLMKCLDFTTAERPRSNPCKIGDTAAPSIALFGDSHAASFVPALSEAVRRNRQSAMLLLHAGCPPVVDDRVLTKAQHACAKYNRAALAQILADEEIKTVIIGARWTYYLKHVWFDNQEGATEFGPLEAPFTPQQTAATAYAMRDMIGAFLKSGRRVILVYPVPELGWNLPNFVVLSKRWGRTDQAISTSAALYRQRNAEAYAALDAIGNPPNLVRLYPARHMCNTLVPQRCVAYKDGVAFYFDDDHLTSAGAQLALPELADMLATPISRP